jgi:anti-sigma factor RsiW
MNDSEREELVAYLDGELDEQRSRAIEARINTDPAVRAEVEALRRAYDLLDYLPRPEPSPNFTHRTLDRLAAVSQGVAKAPLPPGAARRFPWRVLVTSLAVMLCLGLGFVVAPAIPGVEAKPTLSPTSDIDKLLERDQSLLERLRIYRHVTDVPMVNELDRPELFGDEHLGY